MFYVKVLLDMVDRTLFDRIRMHRWRTPNRVLDSRGKTRWCPRRKDRDLGRKILDEILVAPLTPLLSPRSYCRAGRGAVRAVLDITRAVATGATWLLHADVVKCFDSIDLGVLRRRLADGGIVGDWVEEIERRCRVVPTGIVAGCPMSPILAELVLGEMDSRLRLPGLIRYADDMIVPCLTRGEAWAGAYAIARTLGAVGLGVECEVGDLRAVEMTVLGVDFRVAADGQVRKTIPAGKIETDYHSLCGCETFTRSPGDGTAGCGNSRLHTPCDPPKDGEEDRVAVYGALPRKEGERAVDASLTAGATTDHPYRAPGEGESRCKACWRRNFHVPTKGTTNTPFISVCFAPGVTHSFVQTVLHGSGGPWSRSPRPRRVVEAADAFRRDHPGRDPLDPAVLADLCADLGSLDPDDIHITTPLDESRKARRMVLSFNCLGCRSSIRTLLSGGPIDAGRRLAAVLLWATLRDAIPADVRWDRRDTPGVYHDSMRRDLREKDLNRVADEMGVPKVTGPG